MNRFRGIKYDQTPYSYNTEANALQAILRGIKGRRRREMVAEAFRNGTLSALPDEFLQSALSETSRQTLGRLHPSLMGGEYLPDLEHEEVEIARISLGSVTFDIIAITAQTVEDGIRYRVIDEYKSEFELPSGFNAPQSGPLSLGELVDFIDETNQKGYGFAGLSLAFHNLNLDDGSGRRDPAELENFAKITSDFYPQLSEHYDRFYRRWVKEESRRD